MLYVLPSIVAYMLRRGAELLLLLEPITRYRVTAVAFVYAEILTR